MPAASVRKTSAPEKGEPPRLSTEPATLMVAGGGVGGVGPVQAPRRSAKASAAVAMRTGARCCADMAYLLGPVVNAREVGAGGATWALAECRRSGCLQLRSILIPGRSEKSIAEHEAIYEALKKRAEKTRRGVAASRHEKTRSSAR